MNWLLVILLTVCLCSESKPAKNLFVIFGKPGSGKTTITNKVVNELNDECVAIDLDACVPETFRENFAKGIYPTSQERIDFMNQACTYVENVLSAVPSSSSKASLSIISFSFVNDDLRQVFHCRFPSAHWILIDTPTDVANRRISQREGHFYKVTTAASPTDASSLLQTNEIQGADSTTSDWNFADVDFDHSNVDGTQDIIISIQRIKSIILSKLRS